MFSKEYILHSLKAVTKLAYKNKSDLERIFSGISMAKKDNEINESCKNAFKSLVSNRVLTAKESEEYIRKYLPELIKIDAKKKRKRKSPIGPYIDNDRLFADHSRMGREWIKKFNNASNEERREIMKEFTESS